MIKTWIIKAWIIFWLSGMMSGIALTGIRAQQFVVRQTDGTVEELTPPDSHEQVIEVPNPFEPDSVDQNFPDPTFPEATDPVPDPADSNAWDATGSK